MEQETGTEKCVSTPIEASAEASTEPRMEASIPESAQLRFQGQVLVAGTAAGSALVLPEPLSLWGGLNPATGEIIDRRHPASGAVVAGRVLVLPAGRGSSSASSILLEAVRAGTAPAAILTLERDGILALGAAVASVLYKKAPPVLVLSADAYQQICTGHYIEVAHSGAVTVMFQAP